MESIFDIAKKLEKEGEDYYRKLAEETPVTELKGVFKFLADQEKDHYDFFDKLAKNEKPSIEDPAESIQLVKVAFEKISANFENTGLVKNAEETYEKAIVAENNAIQYYETLLKEANEQQGESIQLLINEEKNHKLVLESIVEFIRKPKDYLEDAEYSRLKPVY